MEQCNQNLPPTLPQQTPTARVIGDPNQPTTQPTAQAAADPNQPAAQAAAAGAGADSNPPPLPKKRKPNASGNRRTSPAWEHFTKLPATEVKEPTAACNYCKLRYLCDTKQYGTSNMLAHLKVCPKYPHAIITDPNQTTINFTHGEGSGLVAASTRFNVQACRKALALFVTLDEQPFRVVEGEGFKNLCKQLQPQFTLPSRRTVARDCFKIYLDEKLKLKAFFKSDCNRVALTTDCWTSIQNLNYLTVTTHFIDNEWKYQKIIISFSLVQNHKGETIGKKIEQVLRDWGLRNVSTVTMDNASSNDVAVAYLKKKIKHMHGLVGDGHFLHMRCCAHILNLVVSDGLKENHNSISSIRNAVRWVRSSPQRLTKFKECIELTRITCKKLVCLDVPTRWNSTYIMLDAAEKFQAAYERLEEEDQSYVDFFGTDGPPSSFDWENVRAFVNFLKIFYDATQLFSSSQQVSIHTAFRQLASIHCELKKSSMNLNTVLATMGFEMKRKYEKYWGDITKINQLLYFGVTFDPRYKLRYVEWEFNDMYADQPFFAIELFNSLKNNLFKMYNWYKLANEQQNVTGQSSAGPVEDVSPAETSSLGQIPSHVKRVDAFKQHLREKDSIDKQNELERYLSEANIDVGDNFDILLWWKQNSTRYPILSTMVRDVLATPVSTVASESAFSTGGRVVNSYRSSLSPEMAEGLICAQNWLRPSFCQFKDLNLNEEFEVSETVVTEYFGGAGGIAAGARTAATGYD